MDSLANGVIIALVTALTVQSLADFFERQRKSESRRREFYVFLRGWRSEFQRISHEQADLVWQHYLKTVHDFARAAGNVHADIKPQEFWDRVEHLWDFRYEEICGQPHDERRLDTREIICKEIDLLSSYTRSIIGASFISRFDSPGLTNELLALKSEPRRHDRGLLKS
ncbi:MAG TPA: hypothetical protein PLX89_14625 [Verrucomicrobiota bacterium]|nr:hypothetical protein [Verrucomicrobiales bacterium]HRI14228.1 hypothetical protein [Verrucomicrobiota bacterium]